MAGCGTDAGAGGYDDYDDWGLTAEQLDQLERDAIRQLAERKASSAAASTAPAPALAPASPLPSRSPVPATVASSPVGGNHPAARASLEARFGKVESLSPSQSCEANTLRNTVNNSQGSSPKISIHLSLHSSGVIAAKFTYNQLLVNAFRKIPKACWNAKERVWMFPASSLSMAEEVLHTVPGLAVEIHKLDPLVQRALVAASGAKDLQDLYDRIPRDVESKLMPFQREGVRFVLQHGGRALIADEMGLGKTLQAIAVASCLHDAWPVLVIAPSALRLHWASMIQNWLNIPMEDILVVLPQTGGSNKAGLRSVYSNSKGDFCLDGLFNVISYDVVPKIQSTLLDLDFKIIIADESHFIKNAQAKRTIASLPVLLMYTDSAVAKIPAVLDYLGTVIEKKKVKCIRIDGQTPATTRQTLVTDFQNKDDIRAAVLSIKAGGVGLTLTAASTVIFAELSWTPGDLIQAEDRAHRIGQVSSVNIYYLLANETVDDMIWETVQGKLENLGQMLDGQEKALDVSQIDGRPSPSKQQKTLDGYLKRCSNSTEGQPDMKHPGF